MTERDWIAKDRGLVMLTNEEVLAGWHYCPDWDGLLVGPGMDEQEGCTCEVHKGVSVEHTEKCLSGNPCNCAVELSRVKDDQKVTVSEIEYRRLQRDSAKLYALDISGVDNWEGYGMAMELFEEGYACSEEKIMAIGR